jgi:hypothetical protein
MEVALRGQTSQRANEKGPPRGEPFRFQRMILILRSAKRVSKDEASWFETRLRRSSP